MSAKLLKNAYIVDFDDENSIESRDVLIEDDTISAVEANLEAGDAEVIDCTGMVAMPGMADTHTHLWEALFRGRVSEAWGMEYFTNIPPLGSHLTPDDMYAGVYAGATELLYNGVTSVLDFCHAILSPDHADAAVRALQDSGIRALFAYDLAGRDPAGKGVLAPSEGRYDDIQRVQGDLDQDARVRLGVGLNGVTHETIEQVIGEIEFSRSISAHMTFHNNAGGELVMLDQAGALGPDILPAHCNYTTNEDLEALAGCDGSISTQPEAETYAGRRPYSMVGRAKKRGVRVALGVDVPALVNPGVLTQMRLLYLFQRYMDGVHERHEGQVPVARRPGWPQLDTSDVLRAGTTDGVAAMGLGDDVGQVAPGYKADIVLVSTEPFGLSEGRLSAHLVMNTTNADVDTVMVGGEFVKRDGILVGVDDKKMLGDRVKARDDVLARAEAIRSKGMQETWWPWVKKAESLS